ncbi:competence protein ComGD [Salinibacillus kushneri]|uniref:Competence protein ComGD n=1 Tax=Salinibacillus kushneri TaxID=237682 RepID=A0A1I0FWQ3_9BACI|nr:competence type IV pilus minor pilin ComGD [Salinibacillus kushneri]SET62112.1 competence protein ComGD [Salinibacillus kushneri]
MKGSKQKKAGFTLIEMLIVLTIFMFLLLITAPLNSTIKNDLETQQFFSLFEQDILWMQNQSITNNEIYRLRFMPESHTYEIRQKGVGNLKIKREYSSFIDIELGTFQLPFSFYHSGTPNQPGSFYVHTQNETYVITFPFGKGRFYVTKQS